MKNCQLILNVPIIDHYAFVYVYGWLAIAA